MTTYTFHYYSDAECKLHKLTLNKLLQYNSCVNTEDHICLGFCVFKFLDNMRKYGKV